VENNELIDYEEIDRKYIEYVENMPGDYDVEDSVDFLKQEEEAPDESLKQEEEAPDESLKQEEKNNDISPDDKSDTDFFKVSQVCVGDSCSAEYGFDRQYRIDDPEFNSCMDDNKKDK